MAIRRIENNWGAGNSFLKSVPYINTAIASDAVSKAAPRDYREFAKLLVESIHQSFANSALYLRETESTVVNVIVAQIASLLDETMATFLQAELQLIKNEVLTAITTSNANKDDKSKLENKLNNLFAKTTTKEELVELKSWISENVKTTLADASNTESNNTITVEQMPDDSSHTYKNKQVEKLEDTKEGKYKDSTVALNFNVLESFIQTQVDLINKNLKNIPGQSGILSIAGNIGSVVSGVASLTKLVGSKTILGIA